jgi:ubiquitin C-terminal hydrolase
MPNRPSLVKQAFAGELASLIVCDECESVSISKEEFVVLSLSIPSDNSARDENSVDNIIEKVQELSIQKSQRAKVLLKKISLNGSNNQISLLKCIEKFMEVEILDGENKRECEECKKKKTNCESSDGDHQLNSPRSGLSKAFKRYLLVSTPPILVFHLKRFQSFGVFKTKKVDTFVEFDEYLETGPFIIPTTSVEEESQNLKYQLYGLVVHGGNLLGGHYVSYVRYSTDSWFYCSDSHTRSASWDEVRKCQAYLLFYKLI